MKGRILSLHTAARCYCMARASFWEDIYDQLHQSGRATRPRIGAPSWEYTEEALATFPRYNVLGAILTEVERLDPAEIGTITEARELITLAGEVAENEFTTASGNIERSAMREEREFFARHVGGLSEHDLDGVETLFYRRVLLSEESGAVWNRLRSTWGITRGAYWYPLDRSRAEKPDGVEDFDAPGFSESVPLPTLRNLLTDHGDERIWELREYGPEYKLDLSAFEPNCNGVEGYWCSERMDWVIYASHESSITIGGKWLLEAIKHAWPDWRSYTSPPLWGHRGDF
jgi:hypothetical protein